MKDVERKTKNQTIQKKLTKIKETTRILFQIRNEKQQNRRVGC